MDIQQDSQNEKAIKNEDIQKYLNEAWITHSAGLISCILTMAVITLLPGGLLLFPLLYLPLSDVAVNVIWFSCVMVVTFYFYTSVIKGYELPSTYHKLAIHWKAVNLLLLPFIMYKLTYYVFSLPVSFAASFESLPFTNDPTMITVGSVIYGVSGGFAMLLLILKSSKVGMEWDDLAVIRNIKAS